MKIGSKLQYEVPDDCSLDCPHLAHLEMFSQTGSCIRCPVFNCKPVDESGICLIDPDQWPDDSAAEWSSWFKEFNQL